MLKCWSTSKPKGLIFWNPSYQYFIIQAAKTSQAKQKQNKKQMSLYDFKLSWFWTHWCCSSLWFWKFEYSLTIKIFFTLFNSSRHHYFQSFLQIQTRTRKCVRSSVNHFQVSLAIEIANKIQILCACSCPKLSTTEYSNGFYFRIFPRLLLLKKIMNCKCKSQKYWDAYTTVVESCNL